MNVQDSTSDQPRRISQMLADCRSAAEFCRLLNGSGHGAYFVGGAVRDALSGTGCGDVDLATDAPPEQVRMIAKRNGIRTLLSGLRFGSVKLYTGSSPITVTTFRRERVGRNRIAVNFTDSLCEDALRRDFTVNAIYADVDGNLRDPCDGLADLDKRIVRFIGCPDIRIREDASRILRYFRIRASFADLNRPSDPKTIEAAGRHAVRLQDLSREKIGSEMLKLLSARIVFSVLAEMEKCRILPQCLPGCGISKISDLERFENLLDAAPDPLRRLAALGCDNPKDDLRLDRRSALRLERIVHECRNDAPAPELAYRFGERDALDILLARSALSGRKPSPDIRALLRNAAERRFPVRVADLSPKLQGRELGKALNRLEQRWLDSDFGLSRRQLLALAGCERS